MTALNAMTAWLAIAAGVVTGAINGIFFHDDRWLGEYAFWPRRMVRLGHISFFGIAFINLSYALTIQSLHWPPPAAWVSWALASAALLMPLVCFLAAWRKPLRHLFAFPVACVLIGVVGLLIRRATS